jgi:hypothetical protein
LFQVDVDGAVMQAVNFATTLEAMTDDDHRSEASPDESSIPALRSAGLVLARTRRGETLLEDLKLRRGLNTALETGHPVTFHAEDPFAVTASTCSIRTRRVGRAGSLTAASLNTAFKTPPGATPLDPRRSPTKDSQVRRPRARATNIRPIG